MSETSHVRRVHHLLSRLEGVFEALLDRRLEHYTPKEYAREREALLGSGIFEWELRFALGEAERALALADNGAIRTGLAAFHLALGQPALAKEQVDHSLDAPFYDAILHGRVLWALEEYDEARRVFRAFVVSTGARPADAPRYHDGELWYYGELDEVERRYEASLPGAAAPTEAPRLAVAHRYLGEHDIAMAIGREDASPDWVSVERGASLAMQGRTGEAIDALRAAVIDGHVGLDRIAGDPIWNDVQQHPKYPGVVAAYTGSEERPEPALAK